jgi:hypothetical protein
VWEHAKNLFPGFVLFEKKLRRWSYKVEGAFDRKK